MKIVVLDGYALNPGDLSWEDWKPLGELVVYDRTSPDELLSRAGDAEVLLTNKTVLGEAEIEALPALQYIGVLATGYNVVDLQAARKRGIMVTNIPAYSTESVAQMVFAHILNISQRVGHYAEEVHTGVWSRQADFCYWNTPLLELAGKRLGIVGLGTPDRLLHGLHSALACRPVPVPVSLPDNFCREWKRLFQWRSYFPRVIS